MSENNVDFRQKIKDLRIAVERSAEVLKRLETSGKEDDANRSLWTVSSIWNGKEYASIETTLKEMGHKSNLQESMERTKK